MDKPLVAGYVMASADPGVQSRDAQREAIQRYCDPAGLKGVSGFYVDPASEGGLTFNRRAAGRRLDEDLRRGDHVIVRFDRLAGSLLEAAFILESWFRRGVTTHLVDVDIDGVRLEPHNPQARAIIWALVEFGRAGRRMTGSRARETIADLKKQGKRYCRIPPYGYRSEKRRGETVMVPDEVEQVILRRVGELWLEGHSIDAIRQYLAYSWKIKNRNNREFGCSEVRRMAIRGAREMAQELEASET
jgi:DNA invertase Pin-like site-specific DNA recombinase